MGVQSVREQHDQRGGNDQRTGPNKWVSSSTRVFLVQTASKYDDDQIALADPRIPSRGSQHPSNPRLFVVSREALGNPKNRTVWRVEVNYSSESECLSHDPDDPLDDPIKVRWGTAKFEVVAEEDRDGNPLMNTAHEAYDPPAMKDDSRTTLTITRNEATYDPSRSEAFRDTVNQSDFQGFAAGKVKCDSITAGDAWQGCNHYWVVTYVFHVNQKEGWAVKPLNQGFREIPAGETESREIRDADGTLASKPRPLDADGAEIPTADLPDAAIFNEHDVYDESDFDDLQLPNVRQLVEQ